MPARSSLAHNTLSSSHGPRSPTWVLHCPQRLVKNKSQCAPPFRRRSDYIFPWTHFSLITPPPPFVLWTLFGSQLFMYQYDIYQHDIVYFTITRCLCFFSLKGSGDAITVFSTNWCKSQPRAKVSGLTAKLILRPEQLRGRPQLNSCAGDASTPATAILWPQNGHRRSCTPATAARTILRMTVGKWPWSKWQFCTENGPRALRCCILTPNTVLMVN